jgi:hypothetical protein
MSAALQGISNLQIHWENQDRPPGFPWRNLTLDTAPPILR